MAIARDVLAKIESGPKAGEETTPWREFLDGLLLIEPNHAEEIEQELEKILQKYEPQNQALTEHPAVNIAQFHLEIIQNSAANKRVELGLNQFNEVLAKDSISEDDYQQAKTEYEALTSAFQRMEALGGSNKGFCVEKKTDVDQKVEEIKNNIRSKFETEITAGQEKLNEVLAKDPISEDDYQQAKTVYEALTSAFKRMKELNLSSEVEVEAVQSSETKLKQIEVLSAANELVKQTDKVNQFETTKLKRGEIDSWRERLLEYQNKKKQIQHWLDELEILEIQSNGQAPQARETSLKLTVVQEQFNNLIDALKAKLPPVFANLVEFSPKSLGFEVQQLSEDEAKAHKGSQPSSSQLGTSVGYEPPPFQGKYLKNEDRLVATKTFSRGNEKVTGKLIQETNGRVTDQSDQDLSPEENAQVALMQASMILAQYDKTRGENIVIRGQDPVQAARVYSALLALKEADPEFKKLNIKTYVPNFEGPPKAIFQQRMNKQYVEHYLGSGFFSSPQFDECKAALSNLRSARIQQRIEEFNTYKTLFEGKNPGAEPSEKDFDDYLKETGGTQPFRVK